MFNPPPNGSSCAAVETQQEGVALLRLASQCSVCGQPSLVCVAGPHRGPQNPGPAPSPTSSHTWDTSPSPPPPVQDVWNLLPIAAIIDGLAIVVHGGLFRTDGVTPRGGHTSHAAVDVG